MIPWVPIRIAAYLLAALNAYASIQRLELEAEFTQPQVYPASPYVCVELYAPGYHRATVMRLRTVHGVVFDRTEERTASARGTDGGTYEHTYRVGTLTRVLVSKAGGHWTAALSVVSADIAPWYVARDGLLDLVPDERTASVSRNAELSYGHSEYIDIEPFAGDSMLPGETVAVTLLTPEQVVSPDSPARRRDKSSL